MKALEKRLSALEGQRSNSFDHWTDEQLVARISELDAQIDGMIGNSVPEWRPMLARGEVDRILSGAGA